MAARCWAAAVLAVVAALLVSAVGAAKCNSTLEVATLPTVGGNVTCADGSQAKYYFRQGTSRKFVIWFGDGALCGTAEQCNAEFLSKTIDQPDLCAKDPNADVDVTSLFENPSTEEEFGRCYAVRLQHTSTWYETNYSTIYGETMLCADDDHFKYYNLIYVPSCTLDWWLGNGDDTPSAPNALWRGSRVIDTLFSQLLLPPFSISTATRVILGGTGGGGVGVVNSINRLRNGPLAPVFNVMVLLDSAFLVNVERFANLSRVNMGTDAKAFKLDADLRDRTAGWIGGARLDADCKAYWGAGELTRCFYVSETIRRPNFADERVLVLQSQYDLAVLSRLDLLNQSLFRLYADNASYAQNAVNYIEGFGSELRRKLETTAYAQGGADSHFFITPACGQYGFVVPSELQYVPVRSADVGRAGQLEFRRDESVWTNNIIEGLSIRDAIVAWASSEGLTRPLGANAQSSTSFDPLGVNADRCGTFLCNPTCTNRVLPFSLRTIWGPCSQRLIVAYCLIMLAAWWIVFGIAMCAVCMFRRKTSRYWERVVAEERDEYLKDDQAEQKFREKAEEELIRDAFASARQVHLMVRGLSYWAPPKKSGRPYQILRDVSATFPAGKVHAMMGPSGSGKSTLLDVIALTRDSGIITGSHYVNGVDSYSRRAAFLREWLKHNVSYVKQQDNMFPLLTVREHLTHSAWLMLPEFMDTEAKLRRVWQVIKIMGLEKAADTICGDGGVEVEGGISGGQRRRVSVATQLLKLPACLVLDEPTSGLDATNALSLVRSLHTLAHRGGTNVIMTIHQPRREIFRYLDTLKILVGGRILFAGMPKEAFDHFEVSRKLNIGDEVLDQLGKAQLESILSFQRKYERGPLGKRTQEEMAAEVVLDFNATLAAQLEYTLTTNALADGRWSWTESSSAPLLMYVLLSRTIKRGGFDVQKTITISLLGGVLVGIVFLGATDTYRRHISMAYLSVATMTFLQGTFIGDRYWAEKFMYTFESEAGATRPWISFLASMFTRLIVASTTEALAFALPVFFIGKMNNDRDQVRYFLLIIVMCAVTTATQYLMVEVYFMRPDDKRTGALVNIALLAMSALFNGFIIQLQDLPVYLKWIPFIMLAYWAFVGVLINDLQGFTIFCDASVLECSARTGDAVVKGLQYENRDVFQCLFALLIMTGIFLLGSVLIFFFKWVSPLGQGLKRRTSTQGRKDEEEFLARAREMARLEDNTMQNLIKEGKQLQKQGSQNTGLKRNDSAGSFSRLNSAGTLTRNDSQGSGMGTPAADSNRKMILNPSGMERANSEGSLSNNGDVSSPQLMGQDSFNASSLQMVQDESSDDDFRVSKGCSIESGIAWPFVSRIFLVCYFILDFLASATICNGQENSIVEGFEGAGDAIQNVTNIIGTLGNNLDTVSSANINVIFVLVTAIFLIGYVAQYLVQLFLLFPRDINNRINPCTRVALLDILGAAFIVGDFILLFILLGAGKGAQLQIYLLIAIRIIRGLRVMTFWYKISAFHELRVIAYLEYKLILMGEYDPTAYGANAGNDMGDNEADKKPPVPGRDTKPTISTALLQAGFQSPSMRYDRSDAVSVSASSTTGGQSIFRRAVQSIRGSTAMTTEQRRVSLQRRVSVATKRISAKIPSADLTAALAQTGPAGAALTAPVPPTPPTFGRPTPPPVAPRPPVLPAMLRVNMPVIAPPEEPGTSQSRSNRISLRRPFASTAAAPVAPPSRAPGVPPPIAPRTNLNLQGFGLAPGAVSLMQGRRTLVQHPPGYRARKDEPGMDEI